MCATITSVNAYSFSFSPHPPPTVLSFFYSAQWLLRSAVPCCSYQFERMFNTCRIPGTLTGSFCLFFYVHPIFTKKIIILGHFQVQSTFKKTSYRAYHPDKCVFSLLSPSILCVQRHRSTLEWQRLYRGVPQGSLFSALCVPRGQTPVSQGNRIPDSEDPGWSICSLQRRGQTGSPDCWRQVSLECIIMQIIFIVWSFWVTLAVNTLLRVFSTKFPRIPWATARTKYFSSGVNKKSLDCIEKAAFFVTLDDEEQSIMGDNLGESLDCYIKSLLHGKCYNRYFCSKVAALWKCEQSCVKYIFVSVCGKGGLTSLSQLFSTKMERAV